MRKIACVGILCADVIVEKVLKYPEKGVLEKVNSITMHSGGNAMTSAVNLKKLGAESAFIGMIGEDMFGEYLKKCLKDVDVDIRGLKTSKTAQTSTSVLMVDENGERSFFHCTGTNDVFSINDIDYSIIEECDMVFVTGSFLMKTFDGKQTMEFLRKCKEINKETFLDVCFDSTGRWGGILDMCMPYIDYFMPSIDEAILIAKESNPEKIADVFMKKGVKNTIIKMGSSGSFLRKEKEKKGRIFPSFFVKNPVDTTGAGDSFCSGFLCAYSMGKTVEDCMTFANATGAMNVMEKGATTGIKSYNETIDFINKERLK